LDARNRAWELKQAHHLLRVLKNDAKPWRGFNVDRQDSNANVGRRFNSERKEELGNVTALWAAKRCEVGQGKE